MILQSKDDFDQLAELDPDIGTYRFLSRALHPELVTTSPSGAYSIMNATFIALYRFAGDLFFRVKEQEFKLTDNVTSTLTRQDDQFVFQLLDNDTVSVSLSYRPPVSEIPMEVDPTPFIEEEDFDFLRFVHNVLTQNNRRDRVFNR